MTSRQITAVVVKIIAIYMFYSAAVCIPIFIKECWLQLGSHKVVCSFGIAVSVLVGVVAAWIAWKFAASLAKDIRNSEDELVVPHFDREQLEHVLFRILGLYLFAMQLRFVVGNLLRIESVVSNPAGEMADLRPFRIALVVDLILLGLAASFFLKPRFWQEKFKCWETRENVQSTDDRAIGATEDPSKGSDSEAHPDG